LLHKKLVVSHFWISAQAHCCPGFYICNWIKQNLKIRRFIGRSENAVKIQIYTAPIAFLLFRMFRHTNARSLSPKAVLSRISIVFFSPFDASNRAKPPPRQPAQLPPAPQLTLNLTPA
jgi:hypothetical protein